MVDRADKGAGLPFVSVILPTLNSERTLDACLTAIRAQEYPSERLEIVIADGGSSDSTLEIAERHGVELVVGNPLQTGEAGKAAAMEAASGDVFALIDSDNILPDPGWLAQMVEPFADSEVFAAEPLEYLHRREDPALTRYFALLGMNDPLCLYVGNYDRYCAITGRWTDLPVRSVERAGWLELELTPETVPTLGANGCLIRRSALAGVKHSPYYFDIDVIQQIVEGGSARFAKVKCGIAHLYAGKMSDFARKQDRRIRDFLYFSGERVRSYPWERVRARGGVARFCFSTATLLPLVVQMCRGMRRERDAAWLYHIPVCWVTLFCYGRAVLGKFLGVSKGRASRGNWKG